MDALAALVIAQWGTDVQLHVDQAYLVPSTKTLSYYDPRTNPLVQYGGRGAFIAYV